MSEYRNMSEDVRMAINCLNDYKRMLIQSSIKNNAQNIKDDYMNR